MSESNKGSEFTRGLILGSLIGGAAGAIIALLYAPKSGVELRHEIAERSTDIYDRAIDSLAQLENNLGNTVKNTVNEGKAKAQNIIESAKRQADNLISDAERILDDAKNKATIARDAVEEKIQDFKHAAKAGADVFKSEIKNPSN
jgi:gas vesicle protein